MTNRAETMRRCGHKLQTLPLSRLVNPIETNRQLLLSLLLLGGAALAIGITIDLERGIGPPGEWGEVARHIGLALVAGVAEEIVFRGAPKRYLGNFGLIAGTVCWIVLHIFYAPVRSIWRLPMDILLGVFYIKLWRGRLWWLALVIHPLWNVVGILGWQLAKPYL